MTDQGDAKDADQGSDDELAHAISSAEGMLTTGLALPETRFSRAVDGVLSTIGRAASWLWVVLLVVIVFNVMLRYVFGEGRIEFEELQWHINALAFMLAIAYAYRVDAHIRIDLVSTKLRPRLQVWIEFYGTLLLLLPFIAVVVWFGWPFVAHSFAVSEISPSPGGLPFRWLLKAVLPIAFVLLLVAVASRLSRMWAFLTAPQSRSDTSHPLGTGSASGPTTPTSDGTDADGRYAPSGVCTIRGRTE